MVPFEASRDPLEDLDMLPGSLLARGAQEESIR
jgi:hypothetical protein